MSKFNWKTQISQDQLQKILQKMIDDNFDHLINFNQETLNDLSFLELVKADDKLTQILEIQKEFHDERLKFNKISEALKNNGFEIAKNTKDKLDKIKKDIDAFLTEFNTAHTMAIEEKKKRAKEEERKKLEEEEKKRKEEAIASALKMALSRWKLAWEASEREKAEKAYRMELIGLYNSAIDENLKIKDEF